MSQSYKHLSFSMICLIAFHLSSCKPKVNPLESYDRTILLKGIADTVIVPAYTEFYNNCNGLKTAASDFSNNPNSANLTALRLSWNSAIQKWMHCEMLNFGYSNANSLPSQIATTPANFQVIEDEIHGTNTIDETYIESTGTSRKGLAAIEYLIYGTNNTQSILDSFNSSSTAARRKEYLLNLVQHVFSKSDEAHTSWNSGNSYQQFVSQTQLNISGSLNLLVNGLIEHIEFVRRGKVGKPAGIDNGGNTDGNLCEYRLTPRSLENIRENIMAWQDIFAGKNGIGLDDYLNHVNAIYNGVLLSTSISQQLNLCLSKANEISIPLNLAVVQQPEKVAALHLELKKLTVLAKVDLASNLGVTITFSDNDGD